MVRLLGLLSILWSTVSIGQVQPKLDSVSKLYAEKDGMIGLSIGIYDNAGIRTSSAGDRDKENALPFDLTTPTRIASVSKIFTAVSIMQLVEDGKLKLQDNLGALLADCPNSWKEIKVSQVLGHSAGIPGYKNKKEQDNGVEYTSASLKTFLAKKDLIATPGEVFNYSSYGYSILGFVIEEVSGMDLEAYMKANIFDVMAMNDTYFESSSSANVNQSKKYHVNNKGKLKLINEGSNLSDRLAAGGIISTSKDLLLFAKGLMDGTLISNSSLSRMMEPGGLKKQGNDYGFGLYLYGQNPVLGNVVGHNGAQLGCSSFLFLFPEKEAAIVVLSNTSGKMQEVSNLAVSLFSLVEVD